MLNIKEVFIGKARKYNNYQECDRTDGRMCIECQRWKFSYPYTCNNYNIYTDKAETCLNWADDKNCKVE